MSNVFDILQERGFIEQCTYPDELRELLGTESVTFYIGFDATANSLTLGHLIPIMTMIHMQRAGHKPIVLLGGATTWSVIHQARQTCVRCCLRKTSRLTWNCLGHSLVVS